MERWLLTGLPYNSPLRESSVIKRWSKAYKRSLSDLVFHAEAVSKNPGVSNEAASHTP